MKCLICNRRPARNNNYCATCAAKLEADRRRREAQAVSPVKFLVYRGNVAGLVPNGDGTLKAVAVRRNPEGLPKSKTINLNHYCDGYTREQVKRFKAAVLKVCA